MRLLDWIDDRVGYRRLSRTAFEEPVVGGARWAYVFGSALAFLVLVQVVTGMVLAMYYSPSSREAWGSVHYMTHEVRMGWFVRGLHHWAASAMIVLLVLHMLQVFVYGAYRKPREFAWWTGIVLLLTALAFSLTGYLLPWDQRGYWATRVTASIAGTLPWVGGSLKLLLQGGSDFGTLTLTRFFAMHTLVLPVVLLGTLGLHIAIFRIRGATPHWSRGEAGLTRATEPFWPRQVVYDVLFSALVLAVVAGLTLRYHGAPLEAPADPSSNFPARPEWYFLWMFELLKFLPGAWEGIGILAFLVVCLAALVLLPFLDRGASSAPKQRRVVLSVGIAMLAGIVLLTVTARRDDARDVAFLQQRQEAEAAALQAFSLARLGIPPGGAEDLYLNDPVERGKRLFAVQCRACHKAQASGGDSAPDLTDYLSHAWVGGLILDPNRPAYYGRALPATMPATDATADEIAVLTHYVLSLGGVASADARGATAFEDNGCSGCHAVREGESQRTGPTLAGFGSRAWLRGVIMNPAAPEYFGAANRMPAFGGRLSDSEIDDLLTYLFSTRSAAKR